MNSFNKTLIGIILILPCLSTFAQNTNVSAISAINRIEYDYFFEHLKYLASDELKGRDVGSDGFDKAANYVAEEFKKNGMLPFGDSGTYLQKIVFIKPSIVKTSFKFLVQ